MLKVVHTLLKFVKLIIRQIYNLCKFLKILQSILWVTHTKLYNKLTLQGTFHSNYIFIQTKKIIKRDILGIDDVNPQNSTFLKMKIFN